MNTTPQTRHEAREQRRARVRQSWTAKIAHSTPLPATWRAGVQMTDALQAEIVAYGEACAQRAMDEYRGAYSTPTTH